MVALCAAGCAPSSEGRVVRAGELVIGRARVPDGIALLTSDAVLVQIGPRNSVRRVKLADPAAKLWGLGSIDADL